ncbi:MAG: hypothetical protein IPK10_05295 [Bacteroidetes bacterium]|nr:hypothetical protein [Bacteroidota bacterium]
MKYLLLLCLLISPSISLAQLNLVPNPSFEDTVYCPTGNNQIDACEQWLNFGNSPDYFNACSNPAFAVPNAVFGFQYAHTGDAYAGVACYLHPNAAPPPNYREFLGVELNNTLVIGQKYFVSFYLVNPGSFNIAIACNKIGINFLQLRLIHVVHLKLLITLNYILTVLLLTH